MWADSAERDIYFMRQALVAAQAAYDLGEVPVGAVLVRNDIVIAQGFNQSIDLYDASAHAEVMALRAAGQELSNYRLPECELFVTLEPCLMCAGAMMHARLSRIVFGARDAKTGAAGSVLNVFDEGRLNHHAQIVGGVLADESKQILQSFFRGRRASARI